MSITTQRAVITDTLNGISGVKGYAKKPVAPKAGDAWIQLVTIDRETGIAETTWRVYIYLPQSEDKAIDWFESNAESLIMGLQYPEPPLESAGYVDAINSVNLGTSDSPVYGLEITLRS